MSATIRKRAASRESRTLSLDDDDLDPQIRVELERLNSTSEEINRLEKQLDDLRQTFNQTLKESTKRLTQMARQNKRSIRKALDFHKASDIANKALKEAQEAAYKYHNAVDVYNAATETISRAEAATFDGEKRREFDSALQELLNHATMTLSDAEEERSQSKIHHDEKAHAYRVAQERVEFLAKKFKSSIAKTRCYYETKAALHVSLEGIKSEVGRVGEQLSGAKQRYKEALRHLETISETIHEERGIQISLDAQRRGIGVGAENISHYGDDLEIKLEIPAEDDCASDDDCLDSERVLSSDHTDRPAVTVTRRVSGCSDRSNLSEPSSARSSIRGEKVDPESRLPDLRESGDGLSPKASVSSERPFDDIDSGRSGEKQELTNVFRKERTTEIEESTNPKALGNSVPHKMDRKADSLERSEESGFADASSTDGSEIDVDEISDDLDDEVERSKTAASLPEAPKPEAPARRKVLKKLIPDKDEIWL